MPRIYTVETANVLVTVPQDLMQIKGAAGRTVRIRRLSVGATNTTLVTAQSLQLRARYLPATVMDGSGGSAPVPVRTDPGDAAASFTALANDTVQATSGGTAVVLRAWGVHIFAGLDFSFPQDALPPIGPGESFTFELLSTVSGTVNLSTTVEVEEIGG